MRVFHFTRVIVASLLFLSISVAAPASAISITAWYGDLEEQLLFDGMSSPLADRERLVFEIENDSGIEWWDFHFRVECEGCGIDTSTYGGFVDIFGS